MANTTTTRRSTTKRAAAKPAPAPEPEVDDDDLEELEEDEVQESATAKRGSKAADDVVFGVADLCKLLSKGLDKPVTPRELRQLIRKMAREKDPRVNREITAGNRSRYSWSGPKDPEVLAIIAAFKGGGARGRQAGEARRAQGEQGREEAGRARREVQEQAGRCRRRGRGGRRRRGARARRRRRGVICSSA
jgi:hypothetical protein